MTERRAPMWELSAPGVGPRQLTRDEAERELSLHLIAHYPGAGDRALTWTSDILRDTKTRTLGTGLTVRKVQ